MIFLNLPSKEKIHWTNHSKRKMRQYGFSEKRVLRILRKPDRLEEGIAPKTVAAMQIVGTKKNPKEVWMMYQTSRKKAKDKSARVVKVISAWRYPGRTPANRPPVIPDDVMRDLQAYI